MKSVKKFLTGRRQKSASPNTITSKTTCYHQTQQQLEQSPSITESESSHKSSSISTEREEIMSSSSRHHKKEDDVALADKEMEERANRAKELLSMRYKGLRHEQVS